MTRGVQPARAARAVRTIATAGCLVIVPRLATHAQAVSPAAMAKADSGRPPYTGADVKFMQGMIGHHAQAVWMAGLAPTHGAGSALRTLAERIDVSQRDEMAFMQRWLRDRRETVPEPSPSHEMAGMPMPATMMPGMLTHEQMMQLDEARGTEFDRLFLTFMIQHHQGALTMVDQLFSTTGAGQDVTIFRFASDVTADQTTEIERMRSMLSAIPPRSE
jgi:uncharacterized protein (DUF305 family)